MARMIKLKSRSSKKVLIAGLIFVIIAATSIVFILQNQKENVEVKTTTTQTDNEETKLLGDYSYKIEISHLASAIEVVKDDAAKVYSENMELSSLQRTKNMQQKYMDINHLVVDFQKLQVMPSTKQLKTEADLIGNDIVHAVTAIQYIDDEKSLLGYNHVEFGKYMDELLLGIEKLKKLGEQ